MTSYDRVNDTVEDSTRNIHEQKDNDSFLTTNSYRTTSHLPNSTATSKEKRRASSGDNQHQYRLTGLLIVQNLLASALSENGYLRSQITRLEKFCRNLRKHVVGGATDQATTIDSESRYDESIDDTDDNGSLLSIVLRNLRLPEDTVSGKQGTGAGGFGLKKEIHDLRVTRQHQQSVIENLERELSIYHQLQSLDTTTPIERSVVKRLSDYEQMLFIEKTMVRELGIRLEEKENEVQRLERQLDLEHYGRRKISNILNDLLNSFVLCCLEMPDVAMETELKAAFEDMMRKAEQLAVDIRDDIAATVAVALDDGSGNDFLREKLKDFRINDLDELTSSQLKGKVIELHDELQGLHIRCKKSVIEQMRKHKVSTLKAKDLEEKLDKSDADRRLGEMQLGDELRKTRAQLDEFIQTLGHRSSYADKAAQSVRSLVELMEDQKHELVTQRDQLVNELSRLQAIINKQEQDIDILQEEISCIRMGAREEAMKAVQDDMEKMNSNCKRLEENEKSLDRRIGLLEKENRDEREKRRLIEEEAEHERHKMQTYESEIRDLQAQNESLEDSKAQLESKVTVLQQRVASGQQLASTQPSDPSQSVLQSAHDVSWSGRDLHRPILLSRSSHLNRERTDAMEQRERRDDNTAVSTMQTSLTADMMASTPVPHSQSSRPGLSVMSIDNDWSAIRHGDAMPFLSLQTVGHRHSSYADSGLPPSFREGRRELSHAREFGAKSSRHPVSRDVMKCLRCGERFSVNNLEDYERHIQQCYADVS
ncbi:protein Daple-like [Corticium candelabrum]|uniref:protein Daple-like n=1 Tax=Corticium candelabrum TaxID=121492 RepID=UPI002E2716B1|nr:protein Daple-like [Corticium candelabrum]XP_062500125.1 protein Daple-like [Corticium candelabrum]